MKRQVNSYNIVEESNPSTILYHAVAYDENHVKELAESNYINIDDMIIELERINVKTSSGIPFDPYIEECLVK